MKVISGSEKLAPAAAVISALASMACCLPWGIAATLGSFGVALSLERHRPWLIGLSAFLLALGGYSVINRNKSCRRVRIGPTILLVFCVIVVFVIAAFPETAARFLLEGKS